MFAAMIQRTLFPQPYLPVPDEEVVETLRAAIARAGRLPRPAKIGDADEGRHLWNEQRDGAPDHRSGCFEPLAAAATGVTATLSG